MKTRKTTVVSLGPEVPIPYTRTNLVNEYRKPVYLSRLMIVRVSGNSKAKLAVRFVAEKEDYHPEPKPQKEYGLTSTNLDRDGFEKIMKKLGLNYWGEYANDGYRLAEFKIDDGQFCQRAVRMISGLCEFYAVQFRSLQDKIEIGQTTEVLYEGEWCSFANYLLIRQGLA